MEAYKILKKIYNVQALDKIPYHVLAEIDNVDSLAGKAGGNLISRQIIAEIVSRVDTLRCYDKNSPHYIGDR